MTGGVIRAYLVPHVPTFLDEVGAADPSETIRALLQVRDEVVELKPDALAVVSSHWVAQDRFLVNVAERPVCLQDYYGFPDRYYSFRYEPINDPELGSAIAASGEAIRVEATYEWGVDHSHWMPLLFISPEAHIPVVPLSSSLLASKDHLLFGRAVMEASVRLGRRIVMIASMTLTHRLDMITWDGNRPFPEGEAFDRQVIQHLEEAHPEAILDIDRRLWAAARPEANLGPLFVLLGAVGGNCRATLLCYERVYTGVGMATLSFGGGEL